jgi:E3 ubiquitin-protein ligase RGLG
MGSSSSTRQSNEDAEVQTGCLPRRDGTNAARRSQVVVVKSGPRSAGSSAGPGSGTWDARGSATFQTIVDKYTTFEQVTEALREAGLESSNLILGIDYTKSNQWTGRHSFGGKSLHTVATAEAQGAATGAPAAQAQEWNPYQHVIRVVGEVLSVYDDDQLIPVFGFGDTTTTDRSVFPFFHDRPCRGFVEVLERYRELTPRVQLGGPTSFAPVIEAAIQIVQHTRAYHILIIVADGQVTSARDTAAAIGAFQCDSV